MECIPEVWDRRKVREEKLLALCTQKDPSLLRLAPHELLEALRNTLERTAK